MNNKKFSALLSQAANAAEKHRRLCDLVNDECMRRHGVIYSDVDADSIIDVLDVVGGTITASEFDKIMIDAIKTNEQI